MEAQRSRWTDERLDDLSERVMRRGRWATEAIGLRQAVNDLRATVDGLRREVREMRSELYGTRRWLLTMWLGFAALFVEIALRM